MQWSQPYHWLVYALVAIVLLATLWAARSLAISPRLRSWLLFAPRGIVLGGLLVILLNPVRLDKSQLPPRRSQLAYAVDCSRSMALDRPASRLEQVKQAIYRAAEQVPESDRPRIVPYRFGSELAAAASVPQLQASDEASRLQNALEQLPSRFHQDLPKAVVVFSDGQLDATDNLVELAESYRRIKVPIYTYPVGDRRVRGDVAIQELVVPRRARPGTKVPIRTTIRSVGFEGQRVVLQIRSEQPAHAEPLATLPITLSSTPQRYELVVEADRNLSRLALEAPPLQGEAILENNRVPFQLSSGDRKLRVLYMEGTAGSEYRFIHNALTEDPDIECLSMVVDQQYVQRPRLQRVDDPYRGYPVTREELFKFDVVICSDISQGAFTREQMAWTVELVGERGGGFAMVGGHTSFGAGRWDQTSWDKLIPVDMSGGRVGRGYLTQRFRVTVPGEALDHPIWQLLDDPVQNRQALQRMPGFYGTNLIQRLKPAATLLGQSATALPQVGIMPVFACETYGRGRTFALASDSTSYWGQDFERSWGEGDNRYFRKFWRNAVRWLSENSVAGSKRLWVDTDKIIYRPGDPIRLTAVAYNAAYDETTDYRLVAHLRAGNSPASQEAKPAAAGSALSAIATEQRYSGDLEARLSTTPTADGRPFSTLQTAQIEVVASDQDREIARTKVDVQIMYDSRELLNPQPAPGNLAVLAEKSGGQVLRDSDQLAELLRRFPSTPGEVLIQRSPLWDRSLFWGILLALLGLEWSLRRRAGFG